MNTASSWIDLQHQFFDMLQASQYWSVEEMRNHQRNQLGQLLRHARANTDFYQSRLDPIFKANGDIDWDRWHEIPILKRQDLLDSRSAMLARNVPAGHGETKEFSSSGSSGKIVTVTFTGLASIATQAAIFRAQAWHGIDWSKNRLSWSEGGFGEDVRQVETSGPWGPLWDEAARRGRSFPFLRPNKAENILDFLQGNPVDYLYTRPRSAQELALKSLARGTGLKFDRILTLGAGITDDIRADCLQAFGCDIKASYSAIESSCIACECATGSHFHVNSELVLCEILNDADQPCAVGEMGRVVVTPFYYAAQPIIRYELGDLAIAGAPCACGRTLPAIEKIVGRVTHLFRFPGGQVVAPLVPRRADAILQSGYWQFVQTGPLNIEVRYVPNDWDKQGDEAGMADIVRRHTHAQAEISFKRVREIKPNAGGKFVEYLNEYNPPTDGGKGS